MNAPARGVDTAPRGPSGPGPGRRWPRLVVLVGLTALVATGGELAVSRNAQGPALSHQYSSPAAPLASGVWSWPTRGSDPLALSEAGYTLLLDRQTGMLSVRTAQTSYTFPATALVGLAQLPTATHFVVTTDQSELALYSVDGHGHLLETTRLDGYPSFFTVTFSAQLGADHFAGPTFFSNGRTGLPSSWLTHAFSPDPVPPSLESTPTTYLGVHPPFHTAPFAPPPFDLEFQAGQIWTGIGLVQVPDATSLALSGQDGIAVNYPLSLLASIQDRGAGGRVPTPETVPGGVGSGTWLSFPSLVVTFGVSSSAALLAYHSALAQLGEAPVASSPGRRPAWWSWPMVDTWGQQLVTGAARTSPAFTAGWVNNFVDTWKQRFLVDHFTVIIDAQWQARLGYPTPSARFGGVAGMRTLIQHLHAQGLKVVLWWPLWKQQGQHSQPTLVDPTSPGYASEIANQMTELLGTGPGDLGANGLKLDWGFLVPPPTQERITRPQLGIGAALLLRYMTMLSHSAWSTNPGALIDASAVAPQFGATEDTLRLYDASSASTWSYRAALVSAVDPQSLIDGDGWHLNQSQAVAHIVQSAVFGIPAMYYSTRWSGGTPISRALARALGAVLSVGQQRGQGQATLLADGQWAYRVAGRLAASTLASSRALAVYRYGKNDLVNGATVVSALDTGVLVSAVGQAVPTTVEGPSGVRVRVQRRGTGIYFTAVAGRRYLVHFARSQHRMSDLPDSRFDRGGLSPRPKHPKPRRRTTAHQHSLPSPSPSPPA